MFNVGAEAYYAKYLADIRDAQLGNGAIPAVAPLPRVGFYAYTGRDICGGWSEAGAEITYNHYLMYGDKKIIFDNDLYEAIDLKNCVEKRISVGGTSFASVQAQIDYVREKLN